MIEIVENKFGNHTVAKFAGIQVVYTNNTRFHVQAAKKHQAYQSVFITRNLKAAIKEYNELSVELDNQNYKKRLLVSDIEKDYVLIR